MIIASTTRFAMSRLHITKLVKKLVLNPGNKQNIADDMQTVINMLSNSHLFLKEIVQCAGKPPNVICYTKKSLVRVKCTISQCRYTGPKIIGLVVLTFLFSFFS
jgi:membrane-anchored protein YejM (alkaline phosphatase superfamily)